MLAAAPMLALRASLQLSEVRPPSRSAGLPWPLKSKVVVGDRNGSGDWRWLQRSAARRARVLPPAMAAGEAEAANGCVGSGERVAFAVGGVGTAGPGAKKDQAVSEYAFPTVDAPANAAPGLIRRRTSTVGESTNISWHECPVGQPERQMLLGQKGCVVWITGLSGSGKSTVACTLSRELHRRGHLTYILDGDNVRHGLNKDLSFKAEDRVENIRRVGEVGKLFADAGVICIASLISPYRKDRDGCRALLPDAAFVEVFMDMPLEVCEARDPKGLYKLARAGKIKGFTGIDDPYEPPLNCEIVIRQEKGVCPSPAAMAKQIILYLELNGYLHA